jgi:hypothetical protein
LRLTSRLTVDADRPKWRAIDRNVVEGRLPRGINIERLRDPDPSWTTQFQDLGLNPK